MPQESCGIFRVGTRAQSLWPVLAEAARGAEYFLVEAAPSNRDLISVSGSLLGPGQRKLMPRDTVRRARMVAPEEGQLEVFAVVEGGQ